MTGLTARAEALLMQCNWPGNIRELQNVIERAMVTVEDEIINHKHMLNFVDSQDTVENKEIIIEIVPIEQMEKQMIQLALKRYGNSMEGKKQAANALKISLATLYNKLKSMPN